MNSYFLVLNTSLTCSPLFCFFIFGVFLFLLLLIFFPSTSPGKLIWLESIYKYFIGAKCLASDFVSLTNRAV